MKHRSTLTLAAARAATMLAGCKDDQPQPPSDADAPPEKRSIFMFDQHDNRRVGAWIMFTGTHWVGALQDMTPLLDNSWSTTGATVLMIELPRQYREGVAE